MEENNFIHSLENLKKLNDYIEAEVARRIKLAEEPRYRSGQINELAKALSLAQGEFPRVPYNRTTSTWNDEYSDLDITLHKIRPVLSKNELAFSQWCEALSDGGTILHTVLMHSSGQWLESRIKIAPTRNDIKTFDSVMADHKRQQCFSLLGLTVEGDPKDDHAEVAMNEVHDEIASGKDVVIKKPKEAYESLTQEQLDELEEELNGYPDLAEEILKKYKIRALGDMPRSKYRYCIEQVRKFKLYRNEKMPMR